MTDTVFGIDQVNIGAMNILELYINAGKCHRKRSIQNDLGTSCMNKSDVICPKEVKGIFQREGERCKS